MIQQIKQLNLQQETELKGNEKSKGTYDSSNIRFKTSIIRSN